ncbi:uncharacterized protein LOC144098859 isoform X2 [Amblyomma americanum]
MEYLMPSEIARLVLGYLKSTGCHSTWETFLRESPDLKEYAEYARRGREYPTTIGGKNLMQLLDAGFQITQTHGTSSSSGELVPSLQNLSALLRDVLSHMQSAPLDGNTASSPASRNDVHSGASSLPQQPYPGDTQLPEPLRLTTSGGFPPAHHSSSPQQQRLHPHPNGDTLNYHVHTHLPPLPLLPPSIASVLKQKTPSKQLPGGLARFEPPEKDVGVSTLSCHPDPIKTSTLGCCYTRPHDHLAAYEERLLAYMNTFPRAPLYPPRNPFISDEEPVRDSGIDLRKRPETRSDDHPSDTRQPSPASSEAPGTAEKQPSGWQSEPGSDLAHRPESREGHYRESQHSSSAANVSMVTAELESEGFEVLEAAAETQTEVSEEIDVDGSSRGPSPLSSEPGAAGAGSACATSVACTAATSSTPAASCVSFTAASAASSSPMLATVMQQTPNPPVSKSPTLFETPENVGVPPLPSRFPDPDSPRAILAQERSLLPSLTTPVKEIRFDPDRFYSPRRKSLIPRRRLLAGISPSCKQTGDSGSATSSSEECREVSALLDELVHNYPFVTKLVENINQAVVGPDGTCSDGAVSRLEAIPEEAAVDTREMLTSQESTMPDSLIKDILSKTENDPVFEEALAQICERLDTTSEVHGVLVTPSKSCSKSRQQRENSSPRTPSQSRRPVSQPTTPQLMSLFASPRQSHPKTPPRRSPRLSAQAKQAQQPPLPPSPPPAPPPPPSSPPPPSPSPPAARGAPASSENTRCQTPVATRAKPKTPPQTAKVAPVNQTNTRTSPAGNSVIRSPLEQTSPAKQSTNQSPLKLPLPPRSIPKSPLKVTHDGTFRVPVSLPLKSLGRQPTMMLPRVVLSPLKPTVQIVSKATENGETVTCISIPDPPQSDRSPRPRHCTTLEDVIDSVLSPERRRALCQTESVAVPSPPSRAAEAQNPIVIMPDCGQVMLCTSGVTGELRTLTQSPLLASTTSPTISNIIYPNMVFSTVPSMSPINFVMSGAVSTAAGGQLVMSSGSVTKIVPQSGKKPIAKKRLPLLQPREPLPTQPSPPAAFKRLEDAKYNHLMGTRVKNAKRKEILKHGQPGPSTSAQVVGSQRSSVVSQPSTSLASSSNVCNDNHTAPSEPRTLLQLPCSSSSASVSNEKSPRLKSLVTVAAKHATSMSHVRVLDFSACGSRSNVRAQGSVDGRPDGDPSENLAVTLETIRTSLTGAMNRVLRNKECSSGLDSGTKKRKSKPHNAEKAKKARNEEYLKSMDVNKFLDKIHQD